MHRMISRVLAAILLVAPVAVAVGIAPAAAITCAPGDTVNVKVLASPTTVPAGTNVTVTFKAFNCSAATQSVDVVTKSFSPCNPSITSTNPMTFAPHQRIQKDFTFAPSATCKGDYRYTLVVFKDGTRVSKSWADFTVV